jgi:hypothetical protein
MLETPQERVKLLKAGITGKDIEKLYVLYNNLKILGNPILFYKVRADEHDINSLNRGTSEEYGCS